MVSDWAVPTTLAREVNPMRSSTLADPIPLHRLCVPDPERVPFAIGSFDSIGSLSRADFPHRHTFYEIAFVTSGTGSHVLDFTAQPLQPPNLSFITPGQMHHWQDVTGLDGHVVLFNEAFLIAHPRDRDLWQEISRRPWRRLSRDQAGEFGALIDQLTDEEARRQTDFLTVLQALLHIFLVRARRDAEDPLLHPEDRNTRLAADFTRQLAGLGPSQTVRLHAARLGVSVGHLTEVVKAVTGRTPGQLIRQARVLEARRLLGGTDLSVGQISRLLGFEDAAYFCRFFRRETGTTPGRFRAAARKHHVSRIESIDRRPPSP